MEVPGGGAVLVRPWETEHGQGEMDAWGRLTNLPAGFPIDFGKLASNPTNGDHSFLQHYYELGTYVPELQSCDHGSVAMAGISGTVHTSSFSVLP